MYKRNFRTRGSSNTTGWFGSLSLKRKRIERNTTSSKANDTQRMIVKVHEGTILNFQKGKRGSALHSGERGVCVVLFARHRFPFHTNTVAREHGAMEQNCPLSREQQHKGGYGGRDLLCLFVFPPADPHRDTLTLK